MSNNLSVFFIIEMIGTVAFACSGAMVAIKKKLDLLGVIVLGVITAVGGGMIRDIIIGIVPPTLFVKPVYVTAAFVTSVSLFLLVKYMKGSVTGVSPAASEMLLSVSDAVGLGAFTIVGIDTGLAAGYGDYKFLIIFLGVITGVGGGILRDIMAGQTPYILKKHIYACASLAGAVCAVLLRHWQVDTNLATVISAILVVVIRLMARHYEWNLPTA